MKTPRIVPHYSYKSAWLASTLLLLFLAFPASLHAAGENTVDGVTVDADGTDTTDARTKALAQGEMDAFKQLANKRNPEKAAEIVVKTPPTQVSAMVRGFEVVEEKMTATHYHATLRYQFDPVQTQALFEPAALPLGTPAVGPALPPGGMPEHVRKAVLVLPVYNEGTVSKLWEDDNKWRNLWYEAALESGGGMVVVPLGDLDDRVDVGNANANVNDTTSASLGRMLNRYGVGEAYVLTAFYNQKADPKPALEVTLREVQSKGAPLTTHMDYTIRSTETLDTLMVRASNDIARYIHKKQTIDPNKIEYERLKEVDARMNTSDIREWEALRKHLLAHGNIVGIKLTSISFYETTMIITFRGTPDMLGKTLVASGLRVMQDGQTLVLALR